MNYQSLSKKGKNNGIIACLLIPLLCVLRYYESPIGLLANRLSISIMILLAVLIPIISKRNMKMINSPATNSHIIFCMVIAVCYFLSLILYGFVLEGAALVFNKQLYVLLVAVLCLYCFCGYINHQLLIKIYINLSVLFAVLGIIQWLVGFVVGVGLDMKIPFLEYYNNAEKYTLLSQLSSFTHVPSVFAEASHFAAFLLPAIVFLVAKYDSKWRIIKLGILLAGVFVSTSANGLICLAIIIVSFVFFWQENLKASRLFIVVLLMLALVLLLLSGILTNTLEGVFASSSGGDTKADYRIYRGFELFRELPFHQKILGIGNANIQIFYAQGLMHSIFDRSWRAVDFLSAFSAIIIYSGFVGLVAFAVFIKALWSKTNWATRTLILVFLAYSLSEDFYFNEYWLLYVSLICSSRYIFAERVNDIEKKA